MNLHLFRLYFQTPLHISTARSDYSVSEPIIHSDTMYAAIMQAWSVLGLTENIKESISFTLSGLFPFYQKGTDSNPVYFLPKPVGCIPPNNPDVRKKVKKIQYLEQSVFADLLNGNNVYENNFQGSFLIRNTTELPEDGVFKACIQTRNSISIDDASTDLYYIDRLHFIDNSGMYFLFKGTDDDLKNVRTALSYLSDEGLGTDRHVGNGIFKYDEDVVNWFEDVKKGGNMVNLSMFCPESKDQLSDLINDSSRYNISERTGWITSEEYNKLRKKSITMFDEGCVFAASEKILSDGFGGKVVNLRPDSSILPIDKKNIHNIYRVGRSLFVPINL